MTPSPFLTRVVLRNYKSIAACDVRLRALTHLVGANGAGKGNFLDALQFVADALSGSLEHALSIRHGLPSLLHRNESIAKFLSVRLEFQLSDTAQGHYAFSVWQDDDGGHQVADEECWLALNGEQHFFKPAAGCLLAGMRTHVRALDAGELALAACRDDVMFAGVLAALSGMQVYRLAPERMVRPHEHVACGRLSRLGENLASVLCQLEIDAPGIFADIQQYLHAMVRSTRGFECRLRDGMDELLFKQATAAMGMPRAFPAHSMSDGVLHALGLLTALMQGGAGHGPSLIGIEKPEAGLHPNAFAAMRDALDIAREHTQVIVTTHSPELLDDAKFDPEALLAVAFESGQTWIAPITEGVRHGIAEQQYLAGELQHLGQLTPDTREINLGEWYPDYWQYEKS